VKKMIKDSHLAISAVVFSGGEPTLQPRALIELLKYSRDLGLYTAIHTSGVYPDVLQEILARKLVDKIALDIKTTWEYYPALLGNDFTAGVQASLFFCRGAKMHGDLNDFEVVHTVFPGGLHVAMNVSLYAPEIPLVLQQGNLGHRGPSVSPLDLREIANICSNHEGGIRIRSRECGEEQVVSPIKPFGF
jgi:pyruvate formate lyase activating enzyme